MTLSHPTPGAAAPEVVLLTRTGCSACASALAALTGILRDFGLTPQVRDVDVLAEQGDRVTRAEYGDRLPVILLDGAEHSYWEVDEERLRADLRARR